MRYLRIPETHLVLSDTFGPAKLQAGDVIYLKLGVTLYEPRQDGYVGMVHSVEPIEFIQADLLYKSETD